MIIAQFTYINPLFFLVFYRKKRYTFCEVFLMKYLLLSFLLLAACHFHPLYNKETYSSVCVSSIPEAVGYQLHQYLTQSFSNQDSCHYTLQVSTPRFTLSDQSISDDDFITMQRISASTSYKLLDQNKNIVLSNTVSTDASSAVVTNPYSTVVSIEKTKQNLIPILSDQITLHVAAFLDRNNQ